MRYKRGTGLQITVSGRKRVNSLWIFLASKTYLLQWNKDNLVHKTKRSNMICINTGNKKVGTKKKPVQHRRIKTQKERNTWPLQKRCNLKCFQRLELQATNAAPWRTSYQVCWKIKITYCKLRSFNKLLTDNYREDRVRTCILLIEDSSVLVLLDFT